VDWDRVKQWDQQVHNHKLVELRLLPEGAEPTPPEKWETEQQQFSTTNVDHTDYRNGFGPTREVTVFLRYVDGKSRTFSKPSLAEIASLFKQLQRGDLTEASIVSPVALGHHQQKGGT
jgi:hypothetical protein